MKHPFISICIPAYKRIDFLKRLLESIAVQEFRDFEVILTDDSPGEEVARLCEKYAGLFQLNYFKNHVALGTPENWNESMSKASGKWIKLMHDDDWFSHSRSLDAFADAARKYEGHFLFSSYTNVYFATGKEQKVSPSSFRLRRLQKNAATILSSNLVGPPSVVMHRNDGKVRYDRKIKWLVDIDFYIGRLAFEKPVHIDQHLVHVGLGEDQVTMMCHLKPEVEIPENLYLFNKLGAGKLRSMMVYDAWWRLYRNLDIKDETQLRAFEKGPWPAVLLKILEDVNRWPRKLLQKGLLSKSAMILSYLKNYRHIQ